MFRAGLAIAVLSMSHVALACSSSTVLSGFPANVDGAIGVPLDAGVPVPSTDGSITLTDASGNAVPIERFDYPLSNGRQVGTGLAIPAEPFAPHTAYTITIDHPWHVDEYGQPISATFTTGDHTIEPTLSVEVRSLEAGEFMDGLVDGGCYGLVDGLERHWDASLEVTGLEGDPWSYIDIRQRYVTPSAAFSRIADAWGEDFDPEWSWRQEVQFHMDLEFDCVQIYATQSNGQWVGPIEHCLSDSAEPPDPGATGTGDPTPSDDAPAEAGCSHAGAWGTTWWLPLLLLGLRSREGIPRGRDVGPRSSGRWRN